MKPLIRVCGYLMDSAVREFKCLAIPTPCEIRVLMDFFQPYRTHRAALVGNGESITVGDDVVPDTPVEDTPNGEILSIVMQNRVDAL